MGIELRPSINNTIVAIVDDPEDYLDALALLQVAAKSGKFVCDYVVFTKMEMEFIKEYPQTYIAASRMYNLKKWFPQSWLIDDMMNYQIPFLENPIILMLSGNDKDIVKKSYRASGRAMFSYAELRELSRGSEVEGYCKEEFVNTVRMLKIKFKSAIVYSAGNDYTGSEWE